MNITKTLLSLAMLSTTAMSAEVSIGGMLNSDMVANLDADGDGTVGYESNHELDLTVGVKVSETVTAEAYFTTVVGTMPDGDGSPADRWSPTVFDGLTLMWQATEGLAFSVGDLVFYEGGPSYYGYKTSASVLPETFTRGVQADFAGITLAFGSSDVVDTDSLGNVEPYYADAYLAYSLAMGEELSVKPFGLVRTNQDLVHFAAGLTGSLTTEAFSANVTVGAIQEDGSDLTTTILVEPSVSMGTISVAGSFYYAILGDNPTMPAIPEEGYFYLEPGVALSDLFSVGLPLEYHMMDKDVDDAELWVVPTAYLAVAEGASWSIWGGAFIPLEDDTAETSFSIGSEILIEF
jgi:hypothetical protein